MRTADLRERTVVVNTCSPAQVQLTARLRVSYVVNATPSGKRSR